jgi:alpha-L-rhamnosidase
MITTGSFETSDTTLNQIYKNAYWGIRGNYRGMPTDCPQREERMGWLGDRAIGSQGESFLFDNRHLYAKWLDDIEQAQREDGSIPDVAPNYWMMYNDNMTWPGAYPIIANMFVRAVWRCRTLGKTLRFYPEMAHRILTLMERAARLQYKTADAETFAAEATAVKEAYNRRFFNRETAQYGNNTVTANLLSLCYGMAPEGFEEKVFANIVRKTEQEFNNHVSAGLVGIQWLMRGLSCGRIRLRNRFLPFRAR